MCSLRISGFGFRSCSPVPSSQNLNPPGFRPTHWRRFLGCCLGLGSCKPCVAPVSLLCGQRRAAAGKGLRGSGRGLAAAPRSHCSWPPTPPPRASKMFDARDRVSSAQLSKVHLFSATELRGGGATRRSTSTRAGPGNCPIAFLLSALHALPSCSLSKGEILKNSS